MKVFNPVVQRFWLLAVANVAGSVYQEQRYLSLASVWVRARREPDPPPRL
jgi:hypothetical protein